MTDPLIALDAMGGDNAPGAIVEGAVMAARQFGVRVALVGQADAVERELARLAPRPESITVVEAAEVIGMDESPAQAARQKKQSSIVVGLRMLKQGEADAFVSEVIPRDRPYTGQAVVVEPRNPHVQFDLLLRSWRCLAIG